MIGTIVPDAWRSEIAGPPLVLLVRVTPTAIRLGSTHGAQVLQICAARPECCLSSLFSGAVTFLSKCRFAGGDLSRAEFPI
jgi:hypothetical protein